jgi:hypothetical protein
MRLIRKAVLEPGSVRRTKHGPLLEAIVAMIAEGDEPVTLLKVKAHTGVIGNERADAAAVAAAEGGAGACELRCDVRAHPFDQGLWLATKQTTTIPNETETDTPMDTDGRANGQADGRADGAEPMDTDGPAKPSPEQPRPSGWTYLGDAKQSVRAHMNARWRLGKAQQRPGLYAEMWQRVLPQTLAAESNAFFTSSSVKVGTMQTVLRYRYGLLFNAKLAQRYGLGGDGMCPLCGQQDGGHHIASGCRHPRMQLMYTERHNAVARILIAATA